MACSSDMKAISIQQPWAWAIIHAGKDIENRSWSTSYRGDIVVHATRMQEAWKLPPGVRVPEPHELVLRSVIGIVEIADVVSQSGSRWFTGPVGFVLRNPRPLRQPIPCPGNQRIWELPPRVARAIDLGLGSSKISVPGKSKETAHAARILTVTRGNIANKHLYLREAMDLFPADALGGPDKARAGRPVRVFFGDELADTDVVKDKKIFRQRRWVARFFAAHEIRAGDQVLLERLETYVFRLSRHLK